MLFLWLADYARILHVGTYLGRYMSGEFFFTTCVLIRCGVGCEDGELGRSVYLGVWVVGWRVLGGELLGRRRRRRMRLCA